MSRGDVVFESRGFVTNNGPEQVARIKTKAAALWDEFDNISVPPGNSEGGRLISLAKTELESAVMWGVKAVSRVEATKSEPVSPA